MSILFPPCARIYYLSLNFALIITFFVLLIPITFTFLISSLTLYFFRAVVGMTSTGFQHFHLDYRPYLRPTTLLAYSIIAWVIRQLSVDTLICLRSKTDSIPAGRDNSPP